jgi:hypothetical protein
MSSIDLRDRVTGKNRGMYSTPPAAAPTPSGPPPGRTIVPSVSSDRPANALPMGTGAVVDAAGRPVQRVPQHVAAESATLQAEARKRLDVQPPLGYKGVQIGQTVDYNELSPEHQASIQASIYEMSAGDQPGYVPPLARAQPQPARPQARPSMAPVPVPEAPNFGQARIPGWRPPVAPSLPVGDGATMGNVDPALADLHQRQNAPPREEPVIEFDTVHPPQPEASQFESMQPEKLKTHCDHCGWPFNEPDIPEPSIEERQTFLHATLGIMPYTRTYSLANDAIQVTFRTLTIKEVDLIYRQAMLDASKNRFASGFNFIDQVNRYRLFLQLRQITGALKFDLPEGYDRVVNPDAKSIWEGEPEPGETNLPQIEDYILTQILKTESLMRIVHNECMRFNRLVSRLEALMDNADFWKPIGQQS